MRAWAEQKWVEVGRGWEKGGKEIGNKLRQ